MAESSSGTSAPSIRPLSEDAIARLRSSVTVNSLAGCIQQLIMNSLDASANTIDVTVNLARNSVTVEDNGFGILPSDMQYICQRYATSKSPTDSYFGYHGETLASLSTHSHFHLVSRHRSYRSTHSARFHFGSLISREQITNNSYMLVTPGTKITVDRLWGNLPVRLKAREAPGALDREWNDVLRIAAELSMVVRGVKIVVREETSGKKISFGENAGYPLQEKRDGVDEGSAERKYWLKIMRQLNPGQSTHMEIPGVDRWENVEGKTEVDWIYGMICMDASASKGNQFIFLNQIPIAYSTTSLLYSSINQLFSLSTFGTFEENTRPSRQSAPRKSVDRHPMFVLHIQTGLGNVISPEDFDAENASIVQDVVLLLQQIVEQFLKVGGWVRLSLPIAQQNAEKATANWQLSNPLGSLDVNGGDDGMRLLDIGQWSKSKSSRLDPVEEAGRSSTKPRKKETTALQGVDGDPDSLVWVNPSNNKAVVLDARTGNVKTNQKLKGKEKEKKRISIAGRKPTKGAGKESDWLKKVMTEYKNPVFENTEKPITQVFNPSNISSQSQLHLESQSYTVSEKISKDALRNATVISQVDNKYILVRVSPSSSSKTSSSAASPASQSPLPTASSTTTSPHFPQPPSSIARTPATTPATTTTSVSDSLLVMVDQHAADERIHVESLWKTITSDTFEPTPLKSPIVFYPTSHEHALFKRYNQNFLDWNIVLDVQEDVQKTVSIRAVPFLVADRCVEGSSIAINLCRGYVRELEEQGVLTNHNNIKHEDVSWITKMTKAPRVLVDIVNSRACRSAIMFNDELTMNQCEELVGRLAGCSFPFQCAHGRPSMVPIVDVKGWVPKVEDEVRLGKRVFNAWMKTLEDDD